MTDELAMSIDEILDAFTKPQTYPEAAIEQALTRREELVPVFMEKMAEWTEGRWYPKEGFYYLPSIAVHLLAEWRETSAFKPVLRFIVTQQADDLMGDDITEIGGVLLSRLYNGDRAALEGLALDQSVDEYVRVAALDAYVGLAKEGREPVETVRAFVERLLAELPREQNFIWIGVVNAISSLGFADLVPQVKRLFEEGPAAMGFMEYQHFESDLKTGGYDRDRFTKSPVERLRSWYYADDGGATPEKRLTSDAITAPAGLNRFDTLRNEFRDVGRNDPCPCGSGKKFKKCCLPKVEAGLI